MTEAVTQSPTVTPDDLIAQLADPDGEVRSRAAQELAVRRDPRAVAALVQTLDDYPDLEHAPWTLSTYILGNGGAEVLPAVSPRLGAPARITRARAFLVVLQVLERLRGTAAVAALVAELGDPRGAGDPGLAADRWQAWIAREYPP